MHEIEIASKPELQITDGQQGLGDVQVLVGEEVFRQLAEVDFLAAWERLYGACPWGTVFQGPAFVSTWYGVYCQKRLPILVKAEQEGQLTGLLALYKEAGSSTITGAGANEAAYHTWLTTAPDGGTFIRAALAKLMLRFPRHEVLFKHIPPPTPLQWVEEDPQWKPRCVLQACSRPLMDLKSPDMRSHFQKKSSRARINKLKKLGDMRFERITDKEAFAAVLDELNDQFDFRKGGMLNITPFRSEPLRKELQLALFDQGLLYVTVLRVNGEVVASNIDTIGRNDWVFGVGINTHAPAYGKYSPGIVSFLLLGQQLSEEGVAVYDLTTGGHAYKERLVNTHDQVYELRVGSRPARLASGVKDAVLEPVKRRLQQQGIVPHELKLKLNKKRERLRAAKSAGLGGLLEALVDKLSARAALQVYYIGQTAAVLPDVEVKQNSLSDMLCFDQQGGLLTRWDFLEEAEERLQAGERAFTWVEAGELLCCGWLPATGRQAGLSLPAGAVLLEGLYCHRRGRHRLRAFLEAVARQVAAPLYVVSSKKSLSRRLHEAGFAQVAGFEIRKQENVLHP